MPRGSETISVLNELKQVALHSIPNTTSKHAPQVDRHLLIRYGKQPMENHRGPTHNKKFHRVERISTIFPGWTTIP
jgi:hypothetical protein